MASNNNLGLPGNPPEVQSASFRSWLFNVWQLLRNFDLVGTVQGTTQIDGNLIVTGTTSSGGTTVTGNELITGTLTVDGLTTFAGGATVPTGSNLTGMPLSLLSAASGMDDGGVYELIPVLPIIPTKIAATNTSGQSIATGAGQTVTNWTANINTGGFNAATGVFTVPVSGYYMVTATIFYLNATWAAGNVITSSIFHGASAAANSYFNVEAALTNVFVITLHCSVLMQCAAGDTISVATSQNSGAARTLYTVAGYNLLNITQVQ